jgi:hypothetical protein
MENRKLISGRKGIILLGSILIIGMFLVSLVSAGVGFRKVINLNQGEVHIENLRLQNLDPDGVELVFEGSILEGEEIVSFDGGSKFTVLVGEIIDAPLSVKVPSDANIGDSYPVRMLFRSYPSNPVEGSGTLQFTKGVGISFDVNVVEKVEEPESSQPASPGIGMGWIIVIVIALIILAFIIYGFVRNNNGSAKPVSGKK